MPSFFMIGIYVRKKQEEVHAYRSTVIGSEKLTTSIGEPLIAGSGKLQAVTCYVWLPPALGATTTLGQAW